MNPSRRAADQELTVRYNRTHGAWVLVIGATMLFGLLLYDFMADGQRSLPLAIPYLLFSLMTYAGLTMLLSAAYFTYDLQTDRIVSRGFGESLRSCPGPGYIWGRAEARSAFAGRASFFSLFMR